MKPIVLIGGGGHCKSVIEAAASSGREIKGILDLPSAVGSKCLGCSIIGTDDDIPKFAEECEFIVTVGFIKNPALRNKLHVLVKDANGKFATIVASTAHVSKFAEIERGSVVLHCATVNAGACIGKGSIINSHANIEHDVKIGDYCHISTGAMINGDCQVGGGTFVGSGTAVCNGVKICPNVVLCVGSIVTNDIIASGTYMALPLN